MRGIVGLYLDFKCETFCVPGLSEGGREGGRNEGGEERREEGRVGE